MPDPANTYSDGLLKFGSQLATFTCGGTAVPNCIVEGFNISTPTDKIESKNEYGRKNKRIIIAQPREGKATVQLPALNTAAPDVGSSVTLLQRDGAAVIFTVDAPEEAGDQSGEYKVSISLLEKLN